jgi:transposase, IS30 family
LTITERKTRKEIILRNSAKSSEALSAAICEIRKNYGTNFAKVFKMNTADNGSEFSEFDASVLSEDTKIFYAHPYTSCERGTNERHNGLIHRFI